MVNWAGANWAGALGLSSQQVTQMGQAGGQSMVYPPPHMTSLYGTQYGWDVQAALGAMTDDRLIAQFDKNLAFLREEAERAYQQAIEVANIYAGAQRADARARVQAAQVAANAAVQIANIAAEVQKMDIAARLKIAKWTIQAEREQYAVHELNRPGDWIGRVGYMRGQTPEQAAALEQQAGGLVYGGGMPGPLGTPAPGFVQPSAAPSFPSLPQTTGMPQQFQRPQMPYQAMVGEAGPEVLTVSPDQIDVSPLPRFQEGGTMGWPGGGQAFTGPRERPSWQESRTAAREKRGISPWRAPGNGGGGGGNGGAAPVSPINEMEMWKGMRAGGQYHTPTFQAWTGPRDVTVGGETLVSGVRTPWETNLEDFLARSRQEQLMYANAWRHLMMISGESEDEILANALAAIRNSAWMGMTGPMVAYGGWGR